MAFLCAVGVLAAADTARACGDSCVTCVADRYQQLNDLIDQENDKTRRWVTDEFEYHRRDFFVGYFFHWHILTAMENMSEELTTVAMMQMKMLGSFFDAQHQMETQRLLQQMTARAHKDYQPSVGMCALGTATKRMAHLSEVARTKPTEYETAQRQRQLHSDSRNTTADSDIKDRVGIYTSTFCDPNDNDTGLEKLPCTNRAEGFSINKDVDYTRTVSFPLTLHKDEELQEHLDALSKNLYGHSIFDTLAADYLKNPANQELMLDFRSVIAKRAVAAHSFNSIRAMKMEGDGVIEESEKFLAVLLKQLGITEPDEYDRYLGYRTRDVDSPQYKPSYYAIMEILTKKIYQDPSFYTNLYDKPANVDRKGVAVRGIGLMQDMDMFKSQLRSEAALAVLLETHIEDLHRPVQDRLGKLRPEGPSSPPPQEGNAP